MSCDRAQIAREASLRALRVRSKSGFPLAEPVNVFDIADGLDLSVWFSDIASMEGIYSAASGTILLSSLRPPGRQAFTCAHEIGHHVYGDGEQFDELVTDRSESRRIDPKEFRADVFAGQLLMPKSAVLNGFSMRHTDPRTCTPSAIYTVASWLGVGYTTLVHHMDRSLRMIDRTRADSLRKVKLPAIRQQLLGFSCSAPLVVVDAHWTRSVDTQVGDWVSLPPNTFARDPHLTLIGESGDFTLVQATTPGLGQVTSAATSWSTFVRVSPKDYVGRASYRFEEEAES